MKEEILLMALNLGLGIILAGLTILYIKKVYLKVKPLTNALIPLITMIVIITALCLLMRR